jgi:YD repeat-containing protein
MKSWRRALVLIVGLSAVLLPVAAPAQTPPGGLRPGQSVTLMPDGRWLLLGGQGSSGPVAGSALYDPRTGLSTAMPWILTQPRAWHTATLLPDGAILVIGGTGVGGQVLATAELFDQPTKAFYPVANTALTARAEHTATVLTDGRVLIAGGVGSTGQVLAQAELLDGQVPTAPPASVALSQARQGATATLLADGTVLLWAGVGPNGQPLANGEIVDPVQQRGRLVTQMPPGALPAPLPPQLAESLPASGAPDVPLDALLVLRFSKPLQVDTLNATTVTLSGPAGLLTAAVVPAEGGRLAFISPQGVLAPGTTYTLTVNGPSDPAGFLLPFTSLAFRTTSATPQPSGGSQPPAAPSPHSHQALIPQPAAPPPGAAAQLDEWEWKGAHKNGKPHTRWMDLPPLQAPPDVTALAGRVLRLDGEPLANVTLQYGMRVATSDATGRFLLTDIPDGYHPLLMLGHTANAPGKTYGTFEYGVPVEAKKTTVLPFTIWMPLLDTQNAIQLPGGRTQRKIIGTTARIPGLEVHVPAGVTLRASNGQLLESVSLTPVPIDRTPFPVEPGTLAFIAPQGHGTMVESHDGAMALAGAGVRVIFPNLANHPPGTKLSFRSYDPLGFGWYTLGDLTVSPDGRQIAAGPGVTLGEVGCTWTLHFYRGARAALGGLGLGDPISAASGVFLHAKTDLVVPDVLPIVFRHVYRSDDNNAVFQGDFGPGTQHDYRLELEGDAQAYSFAELPLADRNIHYTRISPGTNLVGAVMEHTTTPTRWYKSQLYWVANVGWEIKLTDGTRYQFKSFLSTGPVLTAIVDRLGNTLTITRDFHSRITRITTPNGRWMEFTTHPNSGKVLSARDNAGRQVSYAYDATTGRLWRVTDVAGGVTEYTYDNIDPAVSNRIVTIKDARGIVYLTNQYDANGRVALQTLADSGTWQFAYTLDGTGKVTQTDATNPRGFVTRATFNADGWETSITQALGRPEQQTTSYAVQPGTNFTNSMTDALGRQTTYAYTTAGYLQSVTSPGPSGSVTWSYTYEPTFNRVQTITDPLSHVTTLGYDASGNLTTITDPRGKVSTLTYNPQGQPLTFTDPLNHQWVFAYDTGDLVSVTDPTGQTATAVTDAVGRPVALTDALGNRTRLDYDAFNQLTKITDPLGGPTSLSYDPNGNLLSVTDARGKVTGYAPDLMDRVQTRTDPRGKPESCRVPPPSAHSPTPTTLPGAGRPWAAPGPARGCPRRWLAPPTTTPTASSPGAGRR